MNEAKPQGPKARELGPGSESRTAQLEADAFRLRLSGATYPQIAEQCGCALSSAWGAVQRVLKRTREETNEQADQVRELELSRLDKALEVIWPNILKGDELSIGVMLKISKRRADLLGLDAPEKHEILGAEIILEVVGTEIRQVEGQEPEQIEGVQAVVPEEIKALAEPMPEQDDDDE